MKDRKKRLALDASIGLLKQIVIILCGFVLPRYMLSTFGSSVNGLVSSIGHFLGFISLLEMGIGPVIQASLYGPLERNDTQKISEVVKSAEKFFRKIAYIFLVYIGVMAFAFPLFINKEYDFWFTASLVLIISISTLAQYLFGITYQLLLNADQRSYVQNSLSIVATILNTAVCIILMECGASVHIVKLASTAIFVLRPLGQLIYVHRHYRIDRKIKLHGEPIQQKWNGFAQHLSAVVCENIDIVLLTLCSTLSSVSVYSIYFLVINGITLLVMTLSTGIDAYFGNILAQKDTVRLKKVFGLAELITHSVTALIFTCTAILIVPFVRVYTNGITDADYIQPLFGVLLTVAYALRCLRVPYFSLINSAGHFKQTQNGSFIATGINLLVSLVLVFRFGLVGIALGTLLAMLYHTVYFTVYLRKNILNRSVLYFLMYILLDSAVFALSWFITRNMELTSITYGGFFLLAVKVFLIVLAVLTVLFAALYAGRIWKERKSR